MFTCPASGQRKIKQRGSRRWILKHLCGLSSMVALGWPVFLCGSSGIQRSTEKFHLFLWPRLQSHAVSLCYILDWRNVKVHPYSRGKNIDLSPVNRMPSISHYKNPWDEIYINAIIFRKFNPIPWAFRLDVILLVFNKVPVADLSQGQILLLITKESQPNRVRICFINPLAIKCYFNVGYLINITIQG